MGVRQSNQHTDKPTHLTTHTHANKHTTTHPPTHTGSTDPNDEADAMAVVADVCTAMLCGEGHAVRGVRHNVTRAWGLICSCEEATEMAVGALVDTVCGVNSVDAEGADDGTGVCVCVCVY